MSGPVALHGGAEFQVGDEPFLQALLASAAERVGEGRPISLAIVPTAAARGRPDVAAANGVAAFVRVAARMGLAAEAIVVEVVDAASAGESGLAFRLAQADVIHLPGGDPDLIPTIMPGSSAWAAIERARARGAILAGASAGAMALAPWTWTASGGVAGLGIVPGLLVVPHADEASWAFALERFGSSAPPNLGALGLAEQTGVIAEDLRANRISWRVVGPGEVRWLAVRGGETIVARSGQVIETTGIPG